MILCKFNGWLAICGKPQSSHENVTRKYWAKHCAMRTVGSKLRSYCEKETYDASRTKKYVMAQHWLGETFHCMHVVQV